MEELAMKYWKEHRGSGSGSVVAITDYSFTWMIFDGKDKKEKTITFMESYFLDF